MSYIVSYYKNRIVIHFENHVEKHVQIYIKFTFAIVIFVIINNMFSFIFNLSFWYYVKILNNVYVKYLNINRVANLNNIMLTFEILSFWRKFVKCKDFDVFDVVYVLRNKIENDMTLTCHEHKKQLIYKNIRKYCEWETLTYENNISDQSSWKKNLIRLKKLKTIIFLSIFEVVTQLFIYFRIC